MLIFKNSTVVKSEHQMSDEEQLAFEEHCKFNNYNHEDYIDQSDLTPRNEEMED
jgi:hypothetical protein